MMGARGDVQQMQRWWGRGRGSGFNSGGGVGGERRGVDMSGRERGGRGPREALTGWCHYKCGALEAKLGDKRAEASKAWNGATCGSVRSVGAMMRMRARRGACDCCCCHC
jgi:hypothetical protein